MGGRGLSLCVSACWGMCKRLQKCGVLTPLVSPSIGRLGDFCKLHCGVVSYTPQHTAHSEPSATFPHRGRLVGEGQVTAPTGRGEEAPIQQPQLGSDPNGQRCTGRRTETPAGSTGSHRSFFFLFILFFIFLGRWGEGCSGGCCD